MDRLKKVTESVDWKNVGSEVAFIELLGKS